MVGGCNPEQRCVLHVNDGDYLNCSVFSIRPEVQLEWMAIHEDITSVSFEGSRLSVTQRKGVFDVNLSGKISYSKSHGNNITVTCRVTQSKEHNFQLSTTIDLLFGNGKLIIDYLCQNCDITHFNTHVQDTLSTHNILQHSHSLLLLQRTRKRHQVSFISL